MKRCRLCGREFPDSYNFCDQDASALPALSAPRRNWLRFTLIGATLIALGLATAILAPQTVRRYLASHLSIEVTGVSAEEGSLSWPPGDVELNLRVHNSAPLAPAIRSLRFDCGLSSRSILTLEWPSRYPGELSIAANGDTDLAVKVSPRHLDPESILSGSQGNARIVCKGPAVFALWGIELSQDLEFEKKL